LNGLSGLSPPAIYQSFRRLGSRHLDDADYATDYGEIDPVFLKEQHSRAAARPIQTLGITFALGTYLSEPCEDRDTAFAITLEDITDHKGHHFDHRNQTDPGTAIRVGIDNGHPLLFFETVLLLMTITLLILFHEPNKLRS